MKLKCKNNSKEKEEEEEEEKKKEKENGDHIPATAETDTVAPLDSPGATWCHSAIDKYHPPPGYPPTTAYLITHRAYTWLFIQPPVLPF